MKQYLTENELAEQLRISRTMLYQLRQEGLPCLKVNRMIRYCPEEVTTWLAKRGHGNANNASNNNKGDLSYEE